VLDEPGEHLEPGAADALTADLLDVTAGRSLVLITHRLAGLESVDEILVMEHGRVVQRGTHDQLLGHAGRYSELWWEEMRTERYAWSPEEPTPPGPPPSMTAAAKSRPATTGASPHDH
jgi:ATP-binding cassette subfamily C protein CydC